jgi:hypothetical protein
MFKCELWGNQGFTSFGEHCELGGKASITALSGINHEVKELGRNYGASHAHI